MEEDKGTSGRKEREYGREREREERRRKRVEERRRKKGCVTNGRGRVERVMGRRRRGGWNVVQTENAVHA